MAFMAPPTPATPRSGGEEVGKILQGLGKEPLGGGEGAQWGIPAVASTGQSGRSCHPPPKLHDLTSGHEGGFRERGAGTGSPEPSLGMDRGYKPTIPNLGGSY